MIGVPVDLLIYTVGRMWRRSRQLVDDLAQDAPALVADARAAARALTDAAAVVALVAAIVGAAVVLTLVVMVDE